MSSLDIKRQGNFPQKGDRQSSFCLIALKQKHNQCKVHDDCGKKERYPKKLQDNSTDGRKTGTLVIAFWAVKLSYRTSLTRGLPTSYLSPSDRRDDRQQANLLNTVSEKSGIAGKWPSETKFQKRCLSSRRIRTFQRLRSKTRNPQIQSAIMMWGGKQKARQKRKITLHYSSLRCWNLQTPCRW